MSIVLPSIDCYGRNKRNENIFGHEAEIKTFQVPSNQVLDDKTDVNDISINYEVIWTGKQKLDRIF